MRRIQRSFFCLSLLAVDKIMENFPLVLEKMLLTKKKWELQKFYDFV